MFKKCSMCNQVWETRDNFLSDSQTSIVGYNVNFDCLELGFFLFNHDCGTTLAIEAKQFTDLYKGKVFKERKTSTPDCPGHCLHEGDLEPCNQECECAYVREVLQLVANWTKN